MPLIDVLREVRATVRQIPGLPYLPEYPAESWNQWPAADVWADSGEWRKGTARTGRTREWAAREGTAVIIIDVFLIRDDLPEDMPDFEPFLDSVPDALFRKAASDDFGGTVRELVSVTWSVLNQERGSDQVIGYRFRAEVVIADEVPTEE